MKYDDDQRRPEEIAAEIDRTRGRIDRTLSAIEQRLAPGQLFEQGLDYLRNSNAREFASNLGTQVRDNPLPVALVGIGLAWLMAGGRNESVSARRLRTQDTGEWADEAMDAADESGESTTSRMADRAREMRDRTSESMREMKDRATGLKHRAGDRVRAVRERAEDLGDAARHQVDRARSGYDRMLREQPLALGAIGLALGAIAAAAAPRTRTEDRILGRASDDVTHDMLETTRDQMNTAERKLDEMRERTFRGSEEPWERPDEPERERVETAALVQPASPSIETLPPRGGVPPPRGTP